MTPGTGTRSQTKWLALAGSPVVAACLLMGVNSSANAIDAAIVRVVSQDIHPFEIAFFRNLFSLIFVLPFLARRSGLTMATRLWPLHSLRAALKLAAMVAFFFAVSLLPLGTAMSIAFTTPLFAALGSMVFLGEPVRAGRIASLGVGLIGVLIVLQPGMVPLGAGSALALASAVGLAGVAMMMKVSAGRESAERIVWFNLIITVPLAGLISAAVWTTPAWPTLLLMAAEGLLGALAQFSFARAMALADASVVMPVDFIRLPLAIALAALLFSEHTDFLVGVGGTIIFAGVLILVKSERRAKFPRADGRAKAEL